MTRILDECRHNLGALGEEVLAVVEDQQRLTPSKICAQTRAQRFVRGLAKAERGGRGAPHECWVGQLAKFDEPHAVCVVVSLIRCCFKRQPRLPDATRTSQRHQSVFGKAAHDLLELAPATDERTELHGQVVPDHSANRLSSSSWSVNGAGWFEWGFSRIRRVPAMT